MTDLRENTVRYPVGGCGVTSVLGLSETEAERRLQNRGPIGHPPTSRSYLSIVRANVFSVSNLILAVFGVVALAFGPPQDALFLGILLSNALIGIVHEVRAKAALDRLAALVAPTATVIRDGRARHVRVEQLVVGDLVRAQGGDGIVADGELMKSDGLRLDESLLTGEFRPVAHGSGETIRSGTFAVEGSGAYVVTAVGPQSYAERLLGEARTFRHGRSPLQQTLNRLLTILLGVLVPFGLVLGYALWERKAPTSEAVPTLVAGLVTLIPEGLIVLTSLTYAVASLRMARRGVLAQEINAFESLASTQVVCLDKTGTLTESTLRVVALVPAAGMSAEPFQHALGRYAASVVGRNATLDAMAAAFPTPAEPVEAAVPFVARRRWGAVRLAGTSYLLGAPDLFPLAELVKVASRETHSGRRVLAFGTTSHPLESPAVDISPQSGVVTMGLVILAEALRPNARPTVEFLRSQGIELKVLSGDAPETVASIAADVGIPTDAGVIDGRTLPSDPSAFQSIARGATVIGRASPEIKRRIVEAPQHAGLHTTMVGDGVNDVPALKAAHLAIAQGSGSAMTRSVADLVLVAGDFGVIPVLVAEGRRVLRNLQRVTKLFVTKSAFAAFLILAIGITPTSYPLLPRHLTLAAALTIGIPSFFLALAPSAGRWRPTDFLRHVARFAVPAGTAAGLGVVSSYHFALNALDLPLIAARSVATTVLVTVGLYLILALEVTGRVRAVAVVALCAVLAIGYAIVLSLPAARSFFALAAPNTAILLVAAGGALVAISSLCLTDDQFIPGRANHGNGEETVSETRS